MLLPNNIRLIERIPGVLRRFVCCAVLTSIALAQVNQVQPASQSEKENVAAALDRLHNGEVNLADINRIARAGAVQSIPDLKKQFELTQDELSKDSMASALVRLGDKDPVWWEYVAQQATAAIESDAPSPMAFDLNGKTVPRPSAELIAWAKVHNLSVDAAWETAMRKLPGELAFLAATQGQKGSAFASASPLISKLHDPGDCGSGTRGTPRQGLDIPNHQSLPEGTRRRIGCKCKLLLGPLERS